MSSKSKKRRPERVSMTKAVTAAEIMFVWAWMDVFHPSPDDVQKLKASLNNVAESVNLGNLNIWEIREAIKIFDLVRLYKSIDWDNYTLIFLGR